MNNKKNSILNEFELFYKHNVKGETDVIRPKLRTPSIKIVDVEYEDSDFSNEEKFVIEKGGLTVISPGAEPLPSGEHIDTVYFNTDKSIEETVDILSKLKYTEDGLCALALGVLNPPDIESINFVLVSAKVQNEETGEIFYGIKDINENVIFVSSQLEDIDFVGWNPQLKSISTDTTLITEQIPQFYPELSEFFADPESISSIIGISDSFEPKSVELEGIFDGSSFSITENGIYNTEDLLNIKKLPLKINVKTKGSDIKIFRQPAWLISLLNASVDYSASTLETNGEIYKVTITYTIDVNTQNVIKERYFYEKIDNPTSDLLALHTAPNANYSIIENRAIEFKNEASNIEQDEQGNLIVTSTAYGYLFNYENLNLENLLINEVLNKVKIKRIYSSEESSFGYYDGIDDMSLVIQNDEGAEKNLYSKYVNYIIAQNIG